MTVRTPIKPPALKKGDLIGIMSPSSVTEKADLEPGLEILRRRGFDVYVHPQTYLRNKSAAGTEAQKSAALKDLFTNKDIKAVFAAGGGNHALFLLPESVDYAMVRRNPKIVMGFSDTTALLNAFNARSGLTTFHGPVVKWMPGMRGLDLTFALLAGEDVAYPMEKAAVFRAGSATGRMIGGNLTLMNYLSGTKYMPDARGAILFIEDVNEEYSNIDRLFWKLRATGVLEQISGLVIGQITGSKDTGKRRYGFNIADIVERNTKGLNFPIVMNAPFGHVARLLTMPVGSPARLVAKGGNVSLSLTEPAVRL